MKVRGRYSISGGVAVFFFQAEDGIRGLVRSRGLGDVYKRQGPDDGGHWRRGRAGDGRAALGHEPAAWLRSRQRLSLIHI